MKEAFVALRSDPQQGRRFRHLLVLDSENRLVGLLGVRDLLRAVFPDYLKSTAQEKHQGISQHFPALSTIWQDDFTEQCARQAAKPLRPYIGPVRATVAIDDPVTKAAYLMVVTDSSMLPVTEGTKVVGAVRVIDVFNEASKAVSGE